MSQEDNIGINTGNKRSHTAVQPQEKDVYTDLMAEYAKETNEEDQTMR